MKCNRCCHFRPRARQDQLCQMRQLIGSDDCAFFLDRRAQRRDKARRPKPWRCSDCGDECQEWCRTSASECRGGFARLDREDEF